MIGFGRKLSKVLINGYRTKNNILKKQPISLCNGFLQMINLENNVDIVNKNPLLSLILN